MAVHTVAVQESAAKRTGGRSALVVAAVRSAVEELVEERGSDRVTVPLIAERAGVNPTSIYRRWGDLSTLINEVADYRLDPNRPLPDSGDLRDDLTVWARQLVAHFGKPANAALLRAGATLNNGEDSECIRMRSAESETLIAQASLAQSSGSAGITVELVIDHVVAPIMFRVIYAPNTLVPNLAERLVGDLFAAASVPA